MLVLRNAAISGTAGPTRSGAPPVCTDAGKLENRRAMVLAAMAERPGQRRKCKVADEFDAFLRARSGGRRAWEVAIPEDVFDWCCFLDSQGNGTTWVHDRSCPSVGLASSEACPPGNGCANRYAARSMDKGFVSKLRMVMREQLGKVEERDPVEKTGDPCSSPLVEFYLLFVNEEQKQVGVPVKQAASMLAHILAQLLQSMRTRAQLAESLSQRIAITRDIALFPLPSYSMRRGFDLSLTLGSRVLQLRESAGLIFNFHCGKRLRKSVDSVVVLADGECPQICAVRGVTEYIAAALAIGWDLTAGYLFPMVDENGGRGTVPLTAPRMTAALQARLRAAGIPGQFRMHLFRVGGSVSRSLEGTAVDEIMKIGGWKTERVAPYYIGATTGASSATSKSKRDERSKRERDRDYAAAIDLPQSPAL